MKNTFGKLNKINAAYGKLRHSDVFVLVNKARISSLTNLIGKSLRSVLSI